MTMTNDPQVAFIAAHRDLKNRMAEQESIDTRVVDLARRKRSLQTCHRYAMTERPRKPAPRETGAYVPELAARIDNDPNLSDGARRCARKLAELTYRSHRDARALPVTVTYLARALGRCRRTVQRYLRQLEEGGYVAVDVIASSRSRMCVGLVVRLLAPLFAAHHRGRWPGSRANPGATAESLKQRYKHPFEATGHRVSVQNWTLHCMNGVFRALMQTNPLAGLSQVRSAQ
ncbi:hypothetical protein Nham_0570 [Nitrobacter hamburgensis X14]|uniref:Uncharacterized protein n=1 Tax=Nitrobacter hamburgensis (strain DSM 10229 / NCIMB 13809 / X14) TaxID=323097 RepID=Q1QQN7_NITHX|nr:helix-turn-helix domain-containing protein [Nitrobacter hamburgensis]ABE61460.1 hypothetical protein Nham_0570 [Nitrobacter hamburgensis X14]